MRTRTRIGAVVALVLFGATFLAGYWPERQKRLAAEREAASMRASVTGLEDQVRAARLHAEVLSLIDAIEAMNYGQAQAQSSAWFDRVRAEAARTSDPGLRGLFGEALAQRDAVTAALAKGDAGALASLQGVERKLRERIGSPSPAGG